MTFLYVDSKRISLHDKKVRSTMVGGGVQELEEEEGFTWGEHARWEI